MFEFTLSANAKHQKLINFMLTGLKPHIIAVQGIIITNSYCGQQNICLAVEENLADEIKGVICEVVSEALVYYYKFEYLNSAISLSINNTGAQDSFVQSLVVFDKQTDKDIIKKNLKLADKLVVDSFYEFRLGELRERWEQIAAVVMDSIPVLLKDRSVAELTRYFIDSSSGAAEEVNLYVDNSTVTLDFGGEKLPIKFDTSTDYQTDLVCEIISLSPQKIIIHGADAVARQIENTLASVFYGRIYVKNA